MTPQCNFITRLSRCVVTTFLYHRCYSGKSCDHKRTTVTATRPVIVACFHKSKRLLLAYSTRGRQTRVISSKPQLSRALNKRNDNETSMLRHGEQAGRDGGGALCRREPCCRHRRKQHHRAHYIAEPHPHLYSHCHCHHCMPYPLYIRFYFYIYANVTFFICFYIIFQDDLTSYE